MGALQHYFLLAIETLLDLGSHVISSEGYEAPGTYADIFRVLRDEGLLGEEEADELMAMARFRNLLVHQYADVDEERVLRIFRTRLEHLDAFVASLRRRFSEELDQAAGGGQPDRLND